MSIVSSKAPVTLIGGGEVSDAELSEALAIGPRLVAADSGGAAALAFGHRPEAVIGDMDSLGDAQRTNLADVLHEISEQDSTDFDKCLRNIAAPLVIAVGFTGARIDHELAVWNVLARRADRPCLVLGSASIAGIVPPRLCLDLPAGVDVSLFPLATVTVSASGLVWPVEQLTMAPDGRIGTSNRSSGPVSIDSAAPGLLVILPRAYLSLLADAFMSAAAAPHGTWPVRDQ